MFRLQPRLKSSIAFSHVEGLSIVYRYVGFFEVAGGVAYMTE